MKNNFMNKEGIYMIEQEKKSARKDSCCMFAPIEN